MNVGNVADPDVLLSGGGIQDEASLAPKLSENMLWSASNAFKHTASQDLCGMFIDFYFFIGAKQKRCLKTNCCSRKQANLCFMLCKFVTCFHD